MGIALEKSRKFALAETEYWFDLLKETSLITQSEYYSIIKDCKDILYILISSTKTIKKKLKTAEK
jgi:four helix bundle protein